jgi:SAM-dependent MidA family methyltransferase
MLFIDYGLPRRHYYRAERSAGTLLCHFRHRFHDDPFVNLGLQDIGAWVDFTAVAEAGVDAGLKVAGFTTQAHFLMGAGIERYLAAMTQAEVTERVNVARQAMLLTLPAEMGERFKVLALSRAFDRPLTGFSVRDLAASL